MLTLPMKFKIDQVAFAVRTDEGERRIKEMFGLTEAKWIEDEVVAEGYVGVGNNTSLSTNKAKLLFNYDLGIELEILRYTEGMNYVDAQHLPECRLCHVGMHLKDGEALDAADRMGVFKAPIIQRVETRHHTNPYLLERGRKYRYTIYDTTPILGTCLKTIERIEKGNDNG